MKKILISVFFIGLISMMFPLCVSAKSITKLDISENNGKISISGTTESGVLAIAAVVYSNDTLIYMETCGADNNTYSCALNKTFSKGNYVVKVADYDGGDYITDDISVTSNKPKSNPKTSDNIMSYALYGTISLIAFVGIGLYTKKNTCND